MKLNIGVFFGGESVEHEVSIISGMQAIAALDDTKYNVIPLYVSKERKLYTAEAMTDITFFAGKKLEEAISNSTEVYIIKEGNKVVVKPAKTKLFGNKEISSIDVAIPVMHGTNGEDGTIQGYLEMLKVPYAGCDLYGASVGQDKIFQKHILKDNGLPITDWFWAYGEELDTNKDELLSKVHKLIYPVILKPSRTGSSVGISIAHNDEEYIECFEEARQYDERIITEKVVKPMREFNCSVLGNSYNAKPSVLEEVNHADDNELLDFKDKYQSNSGSKGSKSGNSQGMASTARIVPAPIDEAETKLIQDFAVKAFKVLGAEGVCRIDFMMDKETKKVYINEMNTIPGSLAFYLWEASGKSFTELMDDLVNLALDRERRRNKMTYSYDTDLLLNYSTGGTKGAKGSKQ